MNEFRLRLPVVLIGVLLCAFFAVITPYNNVLMQNSPLAGGHFGTAAFAIFLVGLVLLNPTLGRLHPALRLHLSELFLLWCMITISTGLAYTGLIRTFILNITGPAWFATTAGEVGEVLRPLLPRTLLPGDAEFMRTLYGGLDGGRQMGWLEILSRIPWSMWIMPMMWWGLFILLVYMALLGLVGVFSHQWIENEKMNFPLLRVPQILGEEGTQGRLWQYLTHKYFLIGLAVPVFLHLFNGLSTYYPQVPELPTVLVAQPYIPKEGLVSGFYKVKIYFYPAFIGFAFLCSKQVSFSFWFFFILGCLLPGFLEILGWHLPAAALGTTFGPVISSVEQMQMIGAFGVFFLFILWLARNHLKRVFQTLLRRRPEGEDEAASGLLSPQTGFYLFLMGFLGLVGWMWYFGMNVFTGVVFLAVCFMLQLVTARLICQGGLPYFTLTTAPTDGFLAFLDTRLIAPVALYLAVVVQKVTFVDMRESLLPSLVHSSKLSENSRPRRLFLIGILLAILAGVLLSFISMLAFYYKYGITAMPDDWAVQTARRVHEDVAHLLEYPEGPKDWSVTFAIIGAGVMLFLVAGYHHFLWWPLHPIGYLTIYSSAMRILWFSFFVGWTFNSLVLRYGGVNAFKEVRRLFVGLVVGDMVMAVFWMIVGLTGPLNYHVLPL